MMPSEVAEWMLDQQGSASWLYQEEIVYRIRKECGEEHTRTNPNGNLAISSQVLKEWRKLTGDTHIWEPGEKAWRLRTDRDPVGKRQADW